MIVQEPIQAAVWHCLNNYAFKDATFLAERLLCEVNTEDTLFLLATVYYRSGKTKRAYTVIKNNCYTSPQLKFLLAKCCYDLGRFDEAERVFAPGSILITVPSYQDIYLEYGSISCFVMQLLGLLCARSQRDNRSHELLRGSLKINPFLWSSFETLCNFGEQPDPSKVFKLDAIDNFTNIHGTTLGSVINTVDVNDSSTNEVINVRGPSVPAPPQTPQIITQPSTPTLNSSITSATNPQQSSVSTPFNYSMARLNTPIAANFSSFPDPMDTNDVNGRHRKTVRFGRISPIIPHFGVLPLNMGWACESDSSCFSPYTLLTPSPLAVSHFDSQSNKIQSVNKRILCRNTKDSPLVMNKPAVFAPTGNNSNFSNPSSGTGYVRRSSRLFGNSSSVKENNKNRFAAPKSPARKTKARSTKTTTSLTDLNEKNKNDNDVIVGEKTLADKNVANVSLNQQGLALQKQSAEGLMTLLKDIGAAYLELSKYNCKKAVQLFAELPVQHSDSTWVVAHIGKSYFEMNDYNQAVHYFSQVRDKDSHHFTFMECYSTALWHLQKETHLSALAQDLLQIDKESPEAWCAIGNSFSLQKEHDAAIKYFSRAIQVDPDFPYAYSLLGHEHLATEELDKALGCYRAAIRRDDRHYNSWYGLGLVFFKQERFSQAEWYFQKAASIHPQCSVLYCHIAVAQHTQKKSLAALDTLERALRIDSLNPLCKYHKASILLALDRYQEALDELLHLKQIIPKESNVYFMLGKAYKRQGDTHLALMNFSWAIDLDPKGANNQFKETIDPANSSPIDEDDQVNNNPHDTIVSEMNSSLIAAESSQESLILEQSSDSNQISGIEEHLLTPAMRPQTAGPSDPSAALSGLRDTPATPRNPTVLGAAGPAMSFSTPSVNTTPQPTTSHSVLSSSSSMHNPNAFNMPARSLRVVGLARQQFSLGFGHNTFDDSLQSPPNQDSQDSPNEEVL